MRRLLIALMTVLVSVPFTSAQPKQEKLPGFTKYVGQLVWFADTPYRGNFIVVDKKHLVTCAHVVWSPGISTERVACSVQGKRFIAKVVKANPETDLAILEPTENVELEAVTPTNEHVFRSDEELLVWGSTSPNDAPQLRRYKVVTETGFHFLPAFGYYGGQRVIIVDHSAPFNLSGSGVFTNDGKLVGIVTGNDYDLNQALFSPVTKEWPSRD